MLGSVKAGFTTNKYLARSHIPAPQRDQENRNETANYPADGFGPLSVEFSAHARANLPADKPAEWTANKQADNRKNRRADKQADVLCRDGRSDANGKQAANGANNSARKRAHVCFAETRFTHQAKVSHNVSKCNRTNGSGCDWIWWAVLAVLEKAAEDSRTPKPRG